MPFGQEDGQDDRGVAFGTSGVHDDWDFGVGSWHDREGIIDDALIEDKYGNWSTYTDSINPLAFESRLLAKSLRAENIIKTKQKNIFTTAIGVLLAYKFLI